MKKGNLAENILEIHTEGGSLIAKRLFLGTQEKPDYLFVWSQSSIPIDEDLGNGFFNSKQKPINSIEELLNDIFKRYPEIFYLSAHYIHNDYKLSVTKKLRSLIKNGKVKVSKMMSFDSWLSELEVTLNELTDLSPFDSKEFVEIIEKFSKRQLYIMEQNGWNRLDFSHSNFDSIDEYSEFLESNNLKNADGYFCDLNKSGVYAYFFGEKCLYVGKAKKLKDRIINHYKSAHNYVKKSNPKDGKRQRELFNYYLKEPLTLFYFVLDDKYNSKVGEHLRVTIEGMLQLEYKPEYDEKLAYTQQCI